MAQTSVDSQGGVANAVAKIAGQFDTINHRFNDTGQFKGILNFYETSFSVYTDNASDELSQPHTAGQLQLIYDEYSNIGGGWYGGLQTIVHKWPVTDNGLFGSNATDGLVHEFGHSREATDEYAANVDAATNSVDGTAYQAPTSIMVYPYGVRNWSDYSVGLINQAAAAVNSSGPALASRDFPRNLQIRVVNSKGRAVTKAKITLYPVSWFSYSVAPSPSVSGSTNSTGYYKFLSNPFKPGTVGAPWDIGFCNFRVKITKGSKIAYAWMPLADVGAAFFSNPTGTYTLTVRVT